jgi:hypothetical protein
VFGSVLGVLGSVPGVFGTLNELSLSETLKLFFTSFDNSWFESENLPFFSPFSVGAFPIQNQTFAAFQMGQFSDSNQELSNEVKNNFKVSESDRLQTF